jgi:NADPH-dependent 7-cyano-7-deazaguanine reductase QueF
MKKRFVFMWPYINVFHELKAKSIYKSFVTNLSHFRWIVCGGYSRAIVVIQINPHCLSNFISISIRTKFKIEEEQIFELIGAFSHLFAVIYTVYFCES